MSPEAHVAISPGVYARAFGSELVLLDFSRGEYFGLDELGAEIWRLAEAGKSLGAIAKQIVEQFETSEETALGDIVELMTHMRDNHLVTLHESGS